MSEDWAAVARAIRARVDELGWRQRELAERSRVSQATVREIQHHTVERHRSDRTLESLSAALGWHPRHLLAVLRNENPPAVDDPGTDEATTLSARLDAMQIQLDQVVERLDSLQSDVSTVVKRVRADD
ncbi:helix-turn-helix domain-containing protein [Sciscionella sediminilitoris]|uniref:helix-turn-helix domain-containing protein n=1 Tax=Sciscionella sediminilitoris TaxID=1445613 RepID=UPI0004DFB44E|nr:helix-turn-helix transcriptional regulator [Sciscionella sp. SE31]